MRGLALAQFYQFNQVLKRTKHFFFEGKSDRAQKRNARGLVLLLLKRLHYWFAASNEAPFSRPANQPSRRPRAEAIFDRAS